MARSSSAARTASCSSSAVAIGTLYDKQYKLEADRFINPGEDFTPDTRRGRCPGPGTGAPELTGD